MPSDLTLIPSYGRDYANKNEVLIAWTTQQNFTIQDVSSPYNSRCINVDDAEKFPELSGTTFRVRYKRRMNVAYITKVDGVWRVK